MENKKKIILLVAVALILLMGTTYAWFNFTKSSEKTNVLHAGTLSLKLSEETEGGIFLTNAYPMTDQEGLNTTVYTFSLVNDGTMDSNYTVYLDDLDLDSTKIRMDDSIVKYNFQKNEESATTGTISSLGTSPNRILDSGVIEKGKTIKYKLQVWMDYSADNSQQATTFSAQLRIEANQITSKNNG